MHTSLTRKGRKRARVVPARQHENGAGPRLTAEDFAQALRRAADPAQARFLQSFFKTGPGQYGHGDVFIGLRVPVVRQHVRQFRGMPPAEAGKLVRSEIHEERLGGLLLWVQAFEKGDEHERKAIFDLYLKNRSHINNWDLVDASAPVIVGESLEPGDCMLLDELVGSTALWDRRIAVLATFAFIRQGAFEPTLRLCGKLLGDKQDLMHKACGWMLREVGKRDRAVLSGFLDQHAAVMPRTMLRYALEHYPAAERLRYMGASARPKSV
ncbi:MAG TPA: DNA alkylation repair protein [Clostridia bacterium]|nr:DNA alkylation repair protein [Clostridia bacterium]